MFSPIAAYPIGALAAAVDDYVAASGAFTASGSSAATVKVRGTAAASFGLPGAATILGGAVERGSLIGFGPIGAGAIGEIISISATALPGISGSVAGSVSFDGAVAGKVLIRGYAPDVVLATWSITPGNASGVINSYPPPPTDPAWSISVGNPGFTILSYPTYLGSVSGVPFFDLGGSAVIGTPIGVSASGTIGFSGASVGQAVASGAAATTFSLSGAAASKATAKGAASGGFSIAGTAIGRYGIFPLSGDAADTFDLSGVATIEVGHNASASGAFGLTGASIAGVVLTASASSIFDLFGSAETGMPSGVRFAFPRQSKNNGRILSEQEAATLLSR